MYILRLQFVITHMLHLKAVFQSIFRSRRPIPEREIWRVGGRNTQILVCILCGVSGIKSLRITHEMMSDYLGFFVPKTAKGCEVLCELRE